MPGETGTTHTDSFRIPAQTGATVAQSTAVYETPFPGTVLSCSLTGSGSINASGVDFRQFSLINTGPSGSGNVVVATLSTASTAMPTDDEVPMVLSATPANLEIQQGDILAVAESTAGAGRAHSGFLGQITQDRDINE